MGKSWLGVCIILFTPWMVKGAECISFSISWGFLGLIALVIVSLLVMFSLGGDGSNDTNEDTPTDDDFI